MTAAVATTLHPARSPGVPARQDRRFRHGLVARRRLVRLLLDSPRAAVALIAAPAGYGKTTLLGEWASHDQRTFAWVTVDERHDDPSSFLVAITDALDKAVPVASGARSGPASGRGQALLSHRPGRALEAREPFVLVIDDLHLLRSSESLELLRALVDGLPHGAQVALGSRTEPALALGRLRANRLLVEIRSRELAMTATEANALLSMAGLELGRDAVDTLVERTEGWPAGIYLAALSVLDQPLATDAIARFGGDDVAIAEFLTDEVLSELTPEALEFLTEAAIVDRLEGPICDAVLERRDSARILGEIARDTLSLVPLDRKGESYRCRRLLSEALSAQRRRLNPEHESQLHRRASDWYAAQGDDEAAIEHAIAAEDIDRAGQLLWAKVPAYVTQGRNSSLQRWLKRFTPAQIAGDARLALAATHSHLVMGELAEAQHSASSARRILHETPPRRRTRDIEAGVAIARAALAPEGLVRMGKDAARAYKLEPEDSPWRPICCLLEGVALHLTGESEAAERRLEEGVRRSVIAAPNVQTLCLAQLALLAAEREDWENAAAKVSRASAQVERYGLAGYPSTALVFAVSGLVHSRLGRTDNAHEDVRQAKRLLSLLDDFVPWYEAELRLALAQAMLRTGDVLGARQLTADAARAVRRVADAVVLEEWVASAEATATAVSDTAAGASLSLTTAELRVLHFLPTHLSFREIASRLYVSGNTVKTQAHAVYRKLDASSRSQAVTRATELGLVTRGQ
jgi:LuxR family transcriptional regulator, maltose regulon positive regulatory protein